MGNIVSAAAVIYIPSGHPIERSLARVCAYVRQRGYRLHALARHVDQALEELEAGDAQVIVMMNPDADPCADPRATTVIDLAAKRDRMLANEATVRLHPCADQLLDDAYRRWLKKYNQHHL